MCVGNWAREFTEVTGIVNPKRGMTSLDLQDIKRGFWQNWRQSLIMIAAMMKANLIANSALTNVKRGGFFSIHRET